MLRGAQPVMWDSKARELPASSAVDEAVRRMDDGDRQAPMGLSVAAGTLTVRANTAVLDDPATVFPVVLDPTTSPPKYSNWAVVDHASPDTEYYNWADDDQGVGYNTWEGYHKKRIYLSFPTSAYNGKQILGASLYAFETYSARCSAGTVNAYLTGDFGATINWNTQPGHWLANPVGSWSVKAGRSD